MCKFGEYCRFNHKTKSKDSRCEINILKVKIEALEKVLDKIKNNFEKLRIKDKFI